MKVDQPHAATPTLEFAFSLRGALSPPVELGEIDGKRRRFIGIVGGEVSGPLQTATVLSGGGDWQTITCLLNTTPSPRD
jgi:hypothetical protein